MTNVPLGLRARVTAAAVLLLAAACAPTPAPICLDDAGKLEWPGLRYVSAALNDGAVRVRGFGGAVPAEAEVTATLPGGVSTSVRADARGRFDIFVTYKTDPSAPPPTIELAAPEHDLSASLRVRSLDDAVACVAGAATAVGATPNDLAIGSCGDDALAFVPTSSDGALEPALLFGADTPAALTFPVDDSGRGAIPWAVALHDAGGLAAVTLFGQHSVALVDVCAGTVLAEASARDPASGPLLIDVSPPAQVSAPLDADGDGDVEDRVSRMRARHPEGVAFVGDRLLVTFTNLLETGPPAVFGPGLVVSFDIDGDQLRSVGHMILPFQNPQSIALDDEGQPWISCSGSLEHRDGRWQASSDGGLVRLDADTLEVVEAVELGRFAPGTPAVSADWIVVGSVLEGSIARVPRGAATMADGSTLATGATGVESLFEAVSFGGDLVLVTELSSDALHVLDVAEGVLHPWPFTRPLAIGPGGDLFRGLTSVARTPAAALRHGAPDAAALLAQSSEVVPLRFWQVMGP